MAKHTKSARHAPNTRHVKLCAYVNRGGEKYIAHFGVDLSGEYTDELVLFKYNDGTWCADNLLDDAAVVWSPRKPMPDPEECLCLHTSVVFMPR